MCTVNKRIEKGSRKEWYNDVYKEINKDHNKQGHEYNREAKK